MGSKGLILWILLGAGVLFVYSAVKNVYPQSLVLTQLGAATEPIPIVPGKSTATAGGAVALTPSAPGGPVIQNAGYIGGATHISTDGIAA